jgi:hypothetical protein
MLAIAIAVVIIKRYKKIELMKCWNVRSLFKLVKRNKELPKEPLDSKPFLLIFTGKSEDHKNG